ncbi:unnamed protein product, partial [Phaeothamnion confervicola]
EPCVVARIVRLVPCSCEPLVVMALRLLHNLSFDARVREQMLRAGALPRLAELLKKAPYRARVLRLLYHLSAEDRCKAMFAYTEAVPIITQLVVNFPRQVLAGELAALAVNLSLHPRNAEGMAAQHGLRNLTDKAVATRDPLVMKIVRNLSQWTYNLQANLENPEKEYRHRGGALWGPCLEPLLELAVDAPDGGGNNGSNGGNGGSSGGHDLLVEVLGTLANLTQLDMPKGATWTLAWQNYRLSALVTRLLVPGMAQADVQLEAIALVGAAAVDDGAARLLTGGPVLPAMHEALRDKGADAEIALQVLYAFWRLLHHPVSRHELLHGVGAVPAMLACLDHPRVPAIRRMAAAGLDLVLEFDRNEDGTVGELGVQVRRHRFRSYNKEWLQYAERAELGEERHVGGGGGRTDDDDGGRANSVDGDQAD